MCSLSTLASRAGQSCVVLRLRTSATYGCEADTPPNMDKLAPNAPPELAKRSRLNCPNALQREPGTQPPIAQTAETTRGTKGLTIGGRARGAAGCSLFPADSQPAGAAATPARVPKIDSQCTKLQYPATGQTAHAWTVVLTQVQHWCWSVGIAVRLINMTAKLLTATHICMIVPLILPQCSLDCGQ